METFRNFDAYGNQAYNRPRLFSTAHVEVIPPLSPHQMPQSDDPRSSHHRRDISNSHAGPPGPHHLLSPRRFGSISASSSSPSAPRPLHGHTFPPPPSNLHHEASASPPHPSSGPHSYLSRRHTSADIRSDGWNPLQAQAQAQAQSQTQTQTPAEPPPTFQTQSPFASGYNSTQWPSSPQRTPNAGDQQLRDSLARYQLGGSVAETPAPNHFGNNAKNSASPSAQHPGLNPNHSNANNDQAAPANNTHENSWTLPPARFPFKDHLKDPFAPSGPSTRRSSMASNVHNLLNPMAGADADDDDVGPDELRKRKRVV